MVAVPGGARSADPGRGRLWAAAPPSLTPHTASAAEKIIIPGGGGGGALVRPAVVALALPARRPPPTHTHTRIHTHIDTCTLTHTHTRRHHPASLIPAATRWCWPPPPSGGPAGAAAATLYIAPCKYRGSRDGAATGAALVICLKS